MGWLGVSEVCEVGSGADLEAPFNLPTRPPFRLVSNARGPNR